MTEEAYSRTDITLANWRQHPFSEWSFQNVPELVPTAEITPPRAAEDLVSEPGLIASLSTLDADGDSLTALEFLRQSHTDRFVMMREGVVLDEWLAPHADAERPHVVFSISKSITGMLAGIAAGDGKLDPADKIPDHVQVKRGGAYHGARLRDLLDMTVSLDFVENYLDTQGDFDRYRRAMLWNPERPGAARETMLDVLASLRKKPHPHSRIYHYASPNTDMLAWSSRRRPAGAITPISADRLWAPMGARGAAHVTVERVGAARAAGGVCVTARDLARFGQLVLDGGQTSDGRELIPQSWVADMRVNGDRNAWLKGNDAHVLPEGRYRSCWYKVGDDRDSFCAIGIHGQWIWIDPMSRVVLVKMSSRPAPSDDAATTREMQFLGQVARGL